MNSVTRKDFVRRSRVHLSCDRCGTTTITCDIGDADLYESGLREHVCGQPQDLSERPALRRMLVSMIDGAA